MKFPVHLTLEVDPEVEEKAGLLAKDAGLTVSGYFEKMILEETARENTDAHLEEPQ